MEKKVIQTNPKLIWVISGRWAVNSICLTADCRLKTADIFLFRPNKAKVNLGKLVAGDWWLVSGSLIPETSHYQPTTSHQPI